MVVEDEMLVSLMIEDILADHHAAVVGPFEEVARALVAARQEHIDAAVLDVNVGGLKVYPVAEALSARRIPFLFVSGYGDAAIPAERSEWQVCSKPFDPTNLVAMLLKQVNQG